MKTILLIMAMFLTGCVTTIAAPQAKKLPIAVVAEQNSVICKFSENDQTAQKLFIAIANETFAEEVYCLKKIAMNDENKAVVERYQELKKRAFVRFTEEKHQDQGDVVCLIDSAVRFQIGNAMKHFHDEPNLMQRMMQCMRDDI